MAVQKYQEIQEKGTCSVYGEVVDSTRKLAKKLDIADESTIRYWSKVGEWKGSDVKKRLERRGKNSMLAIEEQTLVETFVLDCQNSHKHCGADEVINFCKKVTIRKL
jgi:hypothetical protein